MSKRPLSPHLGIYRLTITMAMSVAHRLSGVALYGGTTILVLLFSFAAVSHGNYEAVSNILSNPLVIIISMLYIWALCLHMCGGIRHLIWDRGVLMSKEHANRLAWATLICSFFLAAMIGLYLY